MQGWTLHITEFGKIKKADIQVNPLTLFVGDNNSGKSYVMTLIYGLLNVLFFFDNYEIADETENYNKCCRMVDRFVNTDHEAGDYFYTFAEEEIKEFEILLNKILKRNKRRFLSELFNMEIEAGNIEIAFPEALELQICANYVYSEDNRLAEVTVSGMCGDNRMTGYRMAADTIGDARAYQFYISYILECVLKKGFKNYKKDEVIYFPTTRTGFLLTYKTLTGRAIQDKFSQDMQDETLLTKPNTDFLGKLSSVNTQNAIEKYQELITFVEKNMMTGKVAVSDLPAHDISYIPDGTEKQLPLYITSGVVTEFTPLVLFLRYLQLSTLLFEEPEISLHPELQWQMTRLMIRMVNNGLSVFVTTHSDIVIQHMNNMIKLHKTGRPENLLQNLGYEKEDCLDESKVAVYQFDVAKDNKTIVTRIPCGDYGFEVETFYDTLKKLNNQIDVIEEE